MKNIFLKREDRFLISKNNLSVRDTLISSKDLENLGFNLSSFKKEDMSVDKIRLILTRNKDNAILFISKHYPSLLTTRKDFFENDVIHETSSIARFSRVLMTLVSRKIK